MGRNAILPSEGAEVGVEEAANILNISVESMNRILDDGRIVHRLAGTQRRIRLEAVLEHKSKAEADRLAVLAALAAHDRDLGI